MKKLNKKGFTLVEVIVVLVILAILIAIAVPSVMKYIDDAKDAQIMAQAKGVAQDAELTTIEFFSKREVNDVRTLFTAIQEKLRKDGYENVVTIPGGEVTTITGSDWEPAYVFFNISNIDWDSKIDYNEKHAIESMTIIMQKKGDSKTFKYVPNESFTCTAGCN